MLKMVKRIIKRICRKVGFYDTVEKVYVRRFDVAAGSELLGKKILITGGSSGIGLAIAKKCLAQGAEVVITGRDEKKLNSAVKEIANERLKSIVWDVTDLEIINSKMDEVRRLLAHEIDVLVNNAGMANRQVFGELTPDNWNRTIQLNLTAPVFLSQKVLGDWKNNAIEGIILNISSFAGEFIIDDAYSTSKFALNGITKGMAKYFAKYGIRVNAIAPGVIVGTDINRPQSKISIKDNLRCDWIPSRRYATPDEIAEVASFLISNKSAYINGQTIVVDGAGAIR